MTDADDLQRAFNYGLAHYTLKHLKRAGVGSIIFGIIAMVMGFGAMAVNPVNAVLGLIGVLLFGQGIWISIAPTPAWMLVNGIALIILGIWNIITTIINSSSGHGGVTNLFAPLGIAQITWGCFSIAEYVRFSKLPRSQPSQETLQIIGQTVDGITTAKTKETPDMIEFRTATFFGGWVVWKGRLSEDSAVFVERRGSDAIFARKSDIHLRRRGKPSAGKAIKTEFRLGPRNLVGTIGPESWERYEAWKEARP